MNFYRAKKVLVTGGAGFIGSHLSEQLALAGAHVVLLDNFSTGNLDNIKHIVPSIELIKGDIKSYDACLKACGGVDVVFHLAAFISVQKSFEEPEECFDINTIGTENILKAAINCGVKSLVFSSSAAVYGERRDICRESDELNPKSPYAKSKVDGEELCAEYARKYNLSTACLRYFNVYGERQNPDSEYAAVVAKFTSMLKKGKPLTVFGDGMQTRDFIEVAEVVKANMRLGMQTGLKGEIFNIATGTSMNILDLIAKIKDQLQIRPVGIKFVPARSGDIMHSKADCSKYKQFISGKLTPPSNVVNFPLKSNEKFFKEFSK